MTSQQKRRFSFYIESSVDSPPCSPAGTFSPKRVKGFSGMEPGRCQHIYISIIHTYNIYTKICDIIYILYIYIHVIVILGMDHQPAFSVAISMAQVQTLGGHRREQLVRRWHARGPSGPSLLQSVGSNSEIR